MKNAREDGYILASATISMIILGALATGIVMIAVGELRRVRAEEERVQMMLLYESVAVLTAAELTKEPDARTLRFDAAQQTLAIEGVSFDVSLEWESEKLDLNYADIDMIEAEANALLSDGADVQALRRQLEEQRSIGAPIRLIGDLSFEDARVTECLRRGFSVFGGRRRVGQGVEREGVFDRPTPGTRIRLIAAEQGQGDVADMVLLMTGDRYDPSRMMDWRWLDRDQVNACG
jgi:hypothetical protein